jgi:glycosyltransferase involved in cell wall biosynthesis
MDPGLRRDHDSGDGEELMPGPKVWPGQPYPLGATWDGKGVNFALFSAHAERVELCLFDADGSERERFALPERFLLSPAGRHLHKNYAALLAGCRLLREDGRPVSVVATGALTEVFNGPDVIGLGYVSARDLSVLYALSSGMVQTSLYEAGSWPMWEAMAARRPVAISRIPSVVEYVDALGTPVEYFDPLSPESIAAALGRIWDASSPVLDPAVIESSRERATARTWNDVAGDYLGALESVTREAVAA